MLHGVSSKLLKNLGNNLRLLTTFSKEEKLRSLNGFEGGSVDLELKDDGIAVLTMNYPQKKNSLTGKMMVDLERGISELEAWNEGWGLILRGKDGTFSAGLNLQFLKSLNEKKENGYYKIMSEHMQLTLDRLHNLPLLSVALLEEAALGGGSELALSCDFRIMSNSASLGFLQGIMGLTTACGGTVKLVDLVGRRIALRLLASSSILRSDEALKLGLVDDVFTSEQIALEEALKFLRNFSRSSPDVLRANKQVILKSSRNSSTIEAYEAERNMFQSTALGTAHFSALYKPKAK